MKKLNNIKHLWKRASYTVEAAFILPIFVFVCVFFMNFFVLLRVEIQTEAALQFAGRTAAVDTMKWIPDVADMGAATGLIMGFVAENCEDITQYVEYGAFGFDMLGSYIDENYIDLCLNYRFKPPAPFFKMGYMNVTQHVRTKRWVGYVKDAGEEDGEYVYVTETGSAYHSSDQCSYLNLSIKSTSAATVNAQRNKSGGKYHPCSCYNHSGTVYITSYGDTYHSNLSCSSLKRTVKRVKKDEADGYHACPKCNQGG